MSDKLHDPSAATDTPPVSEAIDSGRRKLAGSALGVAAIFTLSSRPVWANQCTISGMMSGNLSKPRGPACEGCTPGYWRQCQHLDSWIGYRPSDHFNTVFGVTNYVDSVGRPYTLLDVLRGISGNLNYGGGSGGVCALLPPGYVNNPMDSDPISPNLGFHAVAALLSAAHPSVNYGYAAGDIINLFRAHYLTNPAKLKDSLDMLNNRGCPLN